VRVQLIAGGFPRVVPRDGSAGWINGSHTPPPSATPRIASASPRPYGRRHALRRKFRLSGPGPGVGKVFVLAHRAKTPSAPPSGAHFTNGAACLRHRVVTPWAHGAVQKPDRSEGIESAGVVMFRRCWPTIERYDRQQALGFCDRVYAR
jgi:hypothetical protein